MDFVIYMICLGVGLLFTLGTAIFGHVFGGDHGPLEGSGGHAEAGLDASDMPGVSALSPTVIASFVTAFGGIGVILHQFDATRPPLISAPLALLGAFAIACIVLTLLRQLFSHTQSSSESHVSALVGATATVITPIPERGVGEIAYIQGGSRYTAPARVESGAAIPNGSLVRITRVTANQFFVAAE